MSTARRRGALRLLIGASALYALLLVDWQREPRFAEPVVRGAFSVSGALQAGAARSALEPPLPVVRAGYGPLRATAERERDPLAARALVLRSAGKTLAVVLLDLVLVPAELRRTLEERLADLSLDGVILFATHTHSSVGGFDPRLLAQVAGIGRYRDDVVARLLERMERAVREAHGRLKPARLRTAEARVPGWAFNRSTPGAPVDDALTVAVLDADDGAPIAVVAVVAGHPTLLDRSVAELSADYPGAAMRRLEQTGAVALLLQGAGGDAMVRGSGQEAIAAAGAFVAARVSEASERAAAAGDALAFADVEIGLPAVEVDAIRPFVLRRPASNLVAPGLSRRAHVALLRLGDLTLLTVPGEPTALAAERLATAATPRNRGRRPRVVALAQGYVGYVDTPERVNQGHGEALRAWFGPDLLESIEQGFERALRAAEP